MATKKKQTNYIYLALLFAFAIVVFYAFPIIKNPNAYLFAPGGDGIKNYFTTMYYLKFDSSWHFTGMNYPFGEHLVYADGQPILVSILQHFASKYNGIEDFTIMFMNLLMLFSIFPCIVFLFKILKHFGITSGYASIVSVIITFLSPQIDRFTGHYALSYVWVIPALWYFSIKITERLHYINAFWIIVILVVSSGFHAYYLAIGLAFLAALAFCNLFFYNQKQRLLSSFVLLASAGISYGIYSYWLIHTHANAALDRHPNPYGIFAYKATIGGLFLPFLSQESDFLRLFFTYTTSDFEARNYVGIPAIIAIFLFLFFYNALRKKDLNIGNGFAKYFITALVCLLFAMAIPHSILKQNWDNVPDAIKQIRALGRFGWIFYYVFTIMAAIGLYRVQTYLKHKTHAAVALLLTTLLLGTWAMEANAHFSEKMKYIKTNGKQALSYIRNLEYQNILNENNLSSEDFQAILPLPYFHMGSEEWYIERSGASLYVGTEAAYNLHLPIISSYLGRTSLLQSQQAISLLSDKDIPKTLLSKLPNKKPLLLITVDEITDANELNLISKAKLLGTLNNKKIYNLPLEAFQLDTNKYRQYYNSMSRDSFEITIDKARDSIMISSYLPLDTRFAAFSVVVLEITDSKNITTKYEYNPKFSTNIFENQTIARFYVGLKKDKYKIKISLDGKEKIINKTTVQSLLYP